MNKLRVLIEGYAVKIKNGWKASSTTTFIDTGDIKIIVDPGINRKLLLQKLQKNDLETADIDVVYLTHTHIDHGALAGLFENASIVDSELIYKKDEEYEYEDNIPNTNIKVLATPGHSPDHSSLVVPVKEERVVVAGDTFWWMSGDQKSNKESDLLDFEDPFVLDKKALIQSREKILKVADKIVPGHGKAFKNPRVQ